MIARRWMIAAALVGHSMVAFGSNVDGISIAHLEPLERISIRAVSLPVPQKPGALAPVDLSFDALGRNFDLQLVPNAGLLSAMAVADRQASGIPYRGKIKGSENSWARIVVANGMPAGIVWDGAHLYAIEMPGDSLVNTAKPVIFRLADTTVAAGALSCAGGAAASTGADILAAMTANLGTVVAQGPGAVSEINVGAVGDFEFTSARGSNAAAAILTRMNNVDGIFSQQLGVQVNVPVVATFSNSADPFSDTNNPSTLLGELGTYRFNTPDQVSQGLTHLWTGRDLAGSTVGIAYTGALCSNGFGAGLSEGNAGATFDSLIAAHEIGHNFGAPHDGAGACIDEPPDFIMATTLNGSSQFSACSITEMQDDIAAAACITPLPSTDIAVEYNDAPQTVLLGNAATVTFDVVNNGTEPAVDVSTEITLPANVSFLAASSSTATCTNGAGTVSCSFGDIAGGGATTVTVSADTTAVGVDTFDATVTASADDNGSNNQATAQLTVDPAVNLVATVPGQAEVELNQGTSVSVALANQSDLDATGVTLGISMGAGLRADSANWPLGNCTVSASQVDCVAGQFDSQSTSSITIGLTGTAAGNKAFTLTLASNEADADIANNSVNGAVRVRDSANEDEGGGSLGWLLLAILAGASLRRRFSAFRRIS